MDFMLQLFAVIAVFSAVHERALEAMRLPLPRLQTGKWKGWRYAARALDLITAGPLNVLPAIGLALATRANLLTLVKATGAQPAGVDAFFGQYFPSIPLTSEVLLGCVLMGLTTTLGSQFWHDATRALIDLRGGLNALPGNARKLAGLSGEEGDAQPSKVTLEAISQAMQAAANQLQQTAPGETPLAAQLKGELAGSLTKAAKTLRNE